MKKKPKKSGIQHTSHASRDLCPVTRSACDCPGPCALQVAVPPPEGCEARRLPLVAGKA